MSMREANKKRTVCEVHREMYDILIKENIDFGLVDKIKESEKMCARMARKLYEYNKEYDKDWWEANPDYEEDLKRRMDYVLPDKEMGRKVAYTCLFGNNGYTLKEPTFITDKWDYICFTDNKKLKSEHWKIKVVPSGKCPKRESRKYKILNYVYLPEYVLSVYFDTRFIISRNLDKFVRTYLTGDMAVLKHNRRACVYKEIDYLLSGDILNKKEKDVLKLQRNHYIEIGIPDNIGLLAPGIMIRKHFNEKLEKMMNDWYSEVCKYSYRDMVSLVYAANMNTYVSIDLMPFKEVYRSFTRKQNVR